MSRNQKKSIPLQPGQILDKRIKDLNIQITESREKLDQYIDAINNKIGNVISSQMQKFAVVHKQIVEQKDQEIKNLEMSTQQFKETVLCQHVKQLETTLKECKADIERITKILEIFKKESEKYKIQLDIREKQLQSCKKREKKLIKQVWVLQENIKDIYSYEFIAKNARQSPTLQTHQRTSTSFADKPIDYPLKVCKKKKQYRALYTEQVSKGSNSSMNIRIDDQTINSRPSIYNATNLLQKLNSPRKRYEQSRTFRSNTEFKNGKPVLSQRVNNYNIYNDLRHSIRKVDRISAQQPKYLQEKDKLIGKEEFQLISLNAPKIMKMIERLVIEKYGELKEIDQYAINLLNKLFQNQNAVKILQIMLFNYSIEALHQIRQHKTNIIQQNYYSQPAAQAQQEEGPLLSFPKKQAVDTSIRRNFKNNYHKPLLNKSINKSAVK